MAISYEILSRRIECPGSPFRNLKLGEGNEKKMTFPIGVMRAAKLTPLQDYAHSDTHRIPIQLGRLRKVNTKLNGVGVMGDA